MLLDYVAGGHGQLLGLFPHVCISLNMFFFLQCHQKLEEGLERQHTKLQKTLEELRAYQKQHEKWANMNSKVTRNPFINFLHLSITIVTTTTVIDNVLKICISGQLCASPT